MDAGDWIRIKRLSGARNNMETPNAGTVNPAPIKLEVKSGRKVYTEFGTSKIRSPASFFTDFKAFSAADYVMETGGAGTKTLLATRVCDCLFTSDPVRHSGRCIKCGR
jgi:hypothetical protein